MKSKVSLLATVLGAAVATPAFGGITYSTLPDAAVFPVELGVPVLASTLTPQATMTVNQQTGAGNTQAQTFTTGAVGFTLDKLAIYSGGKGGGNIRLGIYAIPSFAGGTNADGFVNTSFSTDLLGGGSGLTVTVNGSGGNQFVVLDLTGADEVALAPNTLYAIEIDVLDGGQWSWQRSAANPGYLGGNIYQGGTEAGFNGTEPANNRGQRNQVGGNADRDGGVALYTTAVVDVPEPAAMAMGLPLAGLILRRRR